MNPEKETGGKYQDESLQLYSKDGGHRETVLMVISLGFYYFKH
jgi:hypothetical protein